MGYFTLPLARMVGDRGCVYALDVQPKMLEGLEHRAQKAGLADPIRARLVNPDSLDAADLAGKIDVVCAFAVVHEMPNAERFFAEAEATMKPDGLLLLAEPVGHVGTADFEAELEAAQRHGLRITERPVVPRSHAAVLKKAA